MTVRSRRIGTRASERRVPMVGNVLGWWRLARKMLGFHPGMSSLAVPPGSRQPKILGRWAPDVGALSRWALQVAGNQKVARPDWLWNRVQKKSAEMC